MKPSQNKGTEYPKVVKTITDLSIQLLAFHAAIMPNGIAIAMENIRVNAATENVGTIRCPIIFVTDVFPNSDSPRSPWKRLPNQIPN